MSERIMGSYPLGEEPSGWRKAPVGGQVLVDRYHPDSLGWAIPDQGVQPAVDRELQPGPTDQGQISVPRGRARIDPNPRLNPHGCGF